MKKTERDLTRMGTGMLEWHIPKTKREQNKEKMISDHAAQLSMKEIGF